MDKTYLVKLALLAGKLLGVLSVTDLVAISPQKGATLFFVCSLAKDGIQRWAEQQEKSESTFNPTQNTN